MTTLDKHKLVIDEWFNNKWHNTKAYMSVYPDSGEAAAAASFNAVIKNPKIQEYIKAKHLDARTIAQTTHEAVLQELRNWAYADITKFATVDLEDLQDLPDDIRRLVTGFKRIVFETKDPKTGEVTSTRTTFELRFADKKAAIDMINKHRGFYEEHNRQKTPVAMTDDQKEARIAELKRKMNNVADDFSDLL